MSLLSAVAPVEAVGARGHGLLEGPRFGRRGAMVYSDVLGGGAWSCSRAGRVRELVPKRRGIGGILAHREGGWVLSGRSVVHVRADGSQRVLIADQPDGGFNDLGSTRDGELLAGVLRFRPFAGEPPRPGQLVRLAAGGELQVLSEQIIWPNGIGVSPDGHTVYISDYARGLVLALSPDGGNAREFCKVPRGSADGLALDHEGGVWVALGEGAAVARFSADGELDGVAPLPARFVSSLCFGGRDMRDVLITAAAGAAQAHAGGMLLRARSELSGLRVSPLRV